MADSLKPGRLLALLKREGDRVMAEATIRRGILAETVQESLRLRKETAFVGEQSRELREAASATVRDRLPGDAGD